MFSQVGFIGSGPVAQAIAVRTLAAGLPVVMSNSRVGDSLTAVVTKLGENARAGTVTEAASADLVVLAVPFVKVPEVAAEIGDWTGRVVIDATNQFAQYSPSYSARADLGSETGSEWVARHLPGSIVVKAFNAMFASFITPDPRHAEGRQVVFYAGDDETATGRVGEFIDRLGFAPVLVGGLRDGGALTQLGGPLSALHVLRQD